ncbi:uncharacterized protein [Arachis hypogaea]|uniref:uncharacterized protein isoform X3 n=2 Tax=Arachis hypogaea TaxID=3818 RepID=UPI000DEC5CFB|nr:uncharacterized protein LOC112747103 [Arachis hypogaea]
MPSICRRADGLSPPPRVRRRGLFSPSVLPLKGAHRHHRVTCVVASSSTGRCEVQSAAATLLLSWLSQCSSRPWSAGATAEGLRRSTRRRCAPCCHCCQKVPPKLLAASAAGKRHYRCWKTAIIRDSSCRHRSEFNGAAAESIWSCGCFVLLFQS